MNNIYEMIKIALIMFAVMLGLILLIPKVGAITDNSLMCRNVYLLPAGKPDSIPCSSETDERCMEYHKKGN